MTNMKNPTKKERKKLYQQAIDVVLFNLYDTNYLCNVLGRLFYGEDFNATRGELFVNEETFPELLLFRELDREVGSAWLSQYNYWNLDYPKSNLNYNEERKKIEKIVNEGKITVLLLCIEMVD